MHPTDSVARIRQENDMPKLGYSIDTAADIKRTDAHGGAPPPEQHCVGTDASQNCAGSEVNVRVPCIEMTPSALALDICLVDRSLLLLSCRSTLCGAVR